MKTTILMHGISLLGYVTLLPIGYVQVDREKVWGVVSAQLPNLIRELESLL